MRFDRIQKNNLFSWKLTDILNTEMLVVSYPCEFGKEVTHYTIELKIPPGRSSNPTSSNLFF